MSSLIVAVAAFVLYLVAYFTYGRFLARKLFGLDRSARTPARELEDGVDYVPSRKEIVFGHHFTSIAGTGPIVGPALAIIWGWVPALLWIVFGCIFMGAVHDFGALVVSLRHEGRSVADVCGRLVNRRVRVIFLAIVSLSLVIVIAIFCLVIARIFKVSPECVFPIWCEIPIAIGLGLAVRRCRSWWSIVLWTVAAVALMYVTVWMGSRNELPMPAIAGFGPIFVWSVILLVYCFIASVLPVQTLLQPRDYINSYQLYIALALLVGGVLLTRPTFVAPTAHLAPEATPTAWPLLFVVIACGAISGFHSLVSGGTSSKQVSAETDAKAIGYGSMLLEGALAVLVVVAVGAGLGLGYEATAKPEDKLDKERLKAFEKEHPEVAFTETTDEQGNTVQQAEMSGKAAFRWNYFNWKAAKGLGVGTFMKGASNMMTALGLPFVLCLTIMGVFIASFAGTTIDTAVRLQRYIIAELGHASGARVLMNRYVASFVTVVTAGVLALWDGEGKGALILWPLFGTLNQLIAALALLVITVYLHARGKPIWFTGIPFVIMVGITGWALVYNLHAFLVGTEFVSRQPHLFLIGLVVAALEVWMIVEVFLHIIRRPKGELA
jgi:carbon starvation protein